MVRSFQWEREYSARSLDLSRYLHAIGCSKSAAFPREPPRGRRVEQHAHEQRRLAPRRGRTERTSLKVGAGACAISVSRAPVEALGMTAPAIEGVRSPRRVDTVFW